MDQLRQDVGNMVEKITKVIAIFRQCHLKMEEYVCLKVIAMASQEGSKLKLKFYFLVSQIFNDFSLFLDCQTSALQEIHQRYLGCLRSFAKRHFPQEPNRVEDLLVRLPEVKFTKFNFLLSQILIFNFSFIF